MKMKNIPWFFVFFFFAVYDLSGQISSLFKTSKIFHVEPTVDKRVELLSIVFRLAGNEEYNTDFFKIYVSSIHKHFEPYKTHPAIYFAKQLAEEKGISFDAVMAMAIHLEHPPLLTPIVSFKERLPEQRWGYEDALKFVSLLKQFYTEAKCEVFFNNHARLYELSARRFGSLIRRVNFNWYQEYYGILSEGKFKLVIGLGNGGGNYGPKLIYPDGKEDLYAIMGTWITDSLGMPLFDEESLLPIIIHEYNHSFVNPLIDDHTEKLEASGRKIFDRVHEQMKSMAYPDWKTMMYEALVRASVIMYMRKHGKDSAKVQGLINRERKNGFIWIDSLANQLTLYESNRIKYPTLRSYMPHIITFYNDLVSTIDDVKKQFEINRPEVVSIEPFKNNTQDVDVSVKEIIIHFDKPLNPNHYSILLGEGGQEQMPITDLIRFANNNTSLRLQVNLKPDQEYSFILGPQKFETADGYSLKEYVVKFKTKK